MKRLVNVVLALSLMASSAYAEKTVMDRLTNDSAFDQTSILFDTATCDKSDAAETLGSSILVVPAVIIESIIWVGVLPFNAIKLGMED
jgi:hypothetical protein